MIHETIITTAPTNEEHSVNRILGNLSSWSIDLVKAIKHHAKVVASKALAISHLFRPATTRAIIKIDHLHHSCKEIEDPKREIFYLYVKGYSLHEISSMSGAHHGSIVTIVYHIMRNLKGNSHLS